MTIERELKPIILLHFLNIVSIFIDLFFGSFISFKLLFSFLLILVAELIYIKLKKYFKIYILLLFIISILLVNLIQFSVFRLILENKYFSINGLALIFLLIYIYLYRETLFKKRNHIEENIELKSLFKKNFSSLTKEEIRKKLENKKFLEEEAILSLKELLEEKSK